MTDLERLFRRLVANLAASDPARLHHPIPLEDIQGSIVPYRTNRRALQLESSEDYEMALLRLCAGEENLVRTEPEEARARFAEELRGPNPDLAVLHQVEHVVVSLRSEPLARALGPQPEVDLPYAPPSRAVPGAEPAADLDLTALELPALEGVAPLEELDDEPPSNEVGESIEPHCLYCGGTLPTDRQIRFCPHCGQRQTPPECPQCHSEVDLGWRHCVNCGAALVEG